MSESFYVATEFMKFEHKIQQYLPGMEIYIEHTVTIPANTVNSRKIHTLTIYRYTGIGTIPIFGPGIHPNIDRLLDQATAFLKEQYERTAVTTTESSAKTLATAWNRSKDQTISAAPGEGSGNHRGRKKSQAPKKGRLKSGTAPRGADARKRTRKV